MKRLITIALAVVCITLVSGCVTGTRYSCQTCWHKCLRPIENRITTTSGHEYTLCHRCLVRIKKNLPGR